MPGSAVIQARLAHVEQRALRGRAAAGDEPLRPVQLVGDAVAEPVAHRALDVGLGGAGQDPAVELDAGPAGHHVALARPGEHRRRHRDAGDRRDEVLERGVHRSGGRQRRAVAVGVVRHGPAGEDGQHPVDHRARLRVRQAAPDPAQQLGQQRHRVAALGGHRGVRRLADRGDPRRVGALVADRDAHHGAAVGELQPQPVALVQREVRLDVGAVLEQPAHADVGRAVLLVGDGEQPQVTTRPEARSGQPGHRDHAGRQLVLHVHGAAAVEVAVVDDGVEGRVGPVPRVGRHHVQVPDEGQRGSTAGPRDARDQVGPVGVAGDQLAGDPGRFQVVPQHHCGCRLAAGRVCRVDPDQGLAQAQDLGPQLTVDVMGGRGHGLHRHTSVRRSGMRPTRCRDEGETACVRDSRA